MKVNGNDIDCIMTPVYTVVPGKIGGMCVTIDFVDWVNELMADHDSYLEIGAFDGVMLSLLAEKNPHKTFHGIDLFIGAERYGHFEYFRENCKRLDNVFCYKGYSEHWLLKLNNMGYSFDIIFIDGGHSYPIVKNDCFKAYDLMRVGGVMIFHDYGNDPVKMAVDEFCESKKLKLEKGFECVYTRVSA